MSRPARRAPAATATPVRRYAPGYPPLPRSENALGNACITVVAILLQPLIGQPGDTVLLMQNDRNGSMTVRQRPGRAET